MSSRNGNPTLLFIIGFIIVTIMLVVLFVILPKTKNDDVKIVEREKGSKEN